MPKKQVFFTVLLMIWLIACEENLVDTLDKSCSDGSPSACIHLADELENLDRKCNGSFFFSSSPCARLNEYSLGANANPPIKVSNALKRAAFLYDQQCHDGDILKLKARSCALAGEYYIRSVYIYREYCRNSSFSECSIKAQRYSEDVGKKAKVAYKKVPPLYQQGCDAGVAGDCTSLGNLYFWGLDVKQSYARASELFEQGCSGGDKLGCEVLIAQQKGNIGFVLGRIRYVLE